LSAAPWLRLWLWAGCLLPASANATPLQAPLAGLQFLVGHWVNGAGHVADTGGTSHGVSDISVRAGGGVLLRRDHTDLFDKLGKPSGGFDQLMVIYAEQGALHADYFEGKHVIHYNAASVDPGRAVIFTSAALPGGPAFRLSYALMGTGLSVAFAIKPQGMAAFLPVADGMLQSGHS
jgi:hypothetical protein